MLNEEIKVQPIKYDVIENSQYLQKFETKMTFTELKVNWRLGKN